jgi:outer membrane protein TolC
MWTVLFFLIPQFVFSQYSLDYFIGKAVDNSPTLKEYQNLRSINRLQGELNRAQNSAFQASLTGDYLFAPYFNNGGRLITTNPSPDAFGYDINLTDGGLYSAKINLERNILNGHLTGVLEKQIQIQDDNFQHSLHLEKHNLEKQVTDQYLTALQLFRLSHLSLETVSNLREQLTLSAGLVEKGYSKLQDYLLLKIELKNQSVILDDTRQQYQSSLYQLYALCGIRDTSVVAVDSVSLKPGAPIVRSDFIQRYTLDSLAAATEQTLFETKYWPQLKLFFNTGLNAVELDRIEKKFGMSAGLNVSIPLFDGGQRRLTRQQNRLAMQTIRASRLYSERNIETQRRNFESRIQSLQQNIRGMEEQAEDYQKLLDISSKQLRQGGVSMIDYLMLIKNYVDLRKNKINMEIDRQLEINNYNYWNW